MMILMRHRLLPSIVSRNRARAINPSAAVDPPSPVPPPPSPWMSSASTSSSSSSSSSSSRSSSYYSSSNARTVRFNEDPRAPSPILPTARRKGWFNSKGDQLWDNDGAYAPAPKHDEYPPDLRHYPEPGTGWMNEEGMRIDMKLRIVRKKPRSALKKRTVS